MKNIETLLNLYRDAVRENARSFHQGASAIHQEDVTRDAVMEAVSQLQRDRDYLHAKVEASAWMAKEKPYVLIYLLETDGDIAMETCRGAEALRSRIAALTEDPGAYAIVHGTTLKSFAGKIDLSKIENR